MTKKKNPPIPDVDTIVHNEPPNENSPVYGEPIPAAQWHGVYTPHWRTYVDCGVGSLADVEYAIEQMISELAFQASADGLVTAVRVEWAEVDGAWYAYGSDGGGETTLPLAKVERVG